MNTNQQMQDEGPKIKIDKEDIPYFINFVNDYKSKSDYTDFFIYSNALDAMKRIMPEVFYEYQPSELKRMYHVLCSWMSTLN